MREFLHIPFCWSSGSLNDNGTRLLRERGIRYCYSYEKLYAKFSGHWCRVEYKKDPDGAQWQLIIMETPPEYKRFCPPDTF